MPAAPPSPWEKPGSFSVKVTPGVPAATTFSETGPLPSGVTFSKAGVLSGTPTSARSAPYNFIDHRQQRPSATQSFTLTVNQLPAITSASHATFVVGQASAFTVTTTGFPVASLSETGALPAGVTLTDNGDGTATLGGTPSPVPAG